MQLYDGVRHEECEFNEDNQQELLSDLPKKIASMNGEDNTGIVELGYCEPIDK